MTVIKDNICGINGNIELKPNCCNLCIYPNQDIQYKCIYPNQTVIDVKMILPNNETRCQE